VIPEAPFLFSIAMLSASLAGLAGLVAGLRRRSDVRPIDPFRLRESGSPRATARRLLDDGPDCSFSRIRGGPLDIGWSFPVPEN
jgi:hypothetical protein